MIREKKLESANCGKKHELVMSEKIGKCELQITKKCAKLGKRFKF